MQLTHRQKAVLYSVFLLGLILRLALVGYVMHHPERYIQDDAVGYDRLAVNLVTGHGFTMNVHPPYVPDNFRVPLYPFTIASVFAVFGHRPDIVLWTQAFMGAITILLIYWLAAKMLNTDTALIAAALFSISPHSITYSALLWADTEYTLLFTLSLIFTCSMLRENKYRWIVLSSVVSGIAVLVHPRSLYLPMLFVLLLVGVRILKNSPVKLALTQAGIYIVFFSLVLFPWRLRNYFVFGVPNLTSAAGINLLYYAAALTESARTGESQWSIADRYSKEVSQISSQPLNPAQSSKVAVKLGLKKIFQDPLAYLKVQILGMAKVFLPGTSQINTLLTGRNSLDTSQIYSLFLIDQDQEFIKKHLLISSTFVWSYIAFEMLFLCGIYFFSLYSITRQIRSTPRLWFIVIILFYLAAVAGPAGSPRFRVVMMPLLSITAAFGILKSNPGLRQLPSRVS